MRTVGPVALGRPLAAHVPCMTGKYLGSERWYVDSALVALLVIPDAGEGLDPNTAAKYGYGVGGACIAFRDGQMSESELLEFLTSLRPVKQAPLPTAPWYDAIIRYDGPISAVQSAFKARLISGRTYERAIVAMFDAGHSA
jgi:hypothetical protein